MGTYVPPLPPQNFVARVTTVKATWLNAMDNLLQGNVPAQGVYDPSIVSGQVQVTSPNGYMASYGDLTFALQGPNPSGLPCPVLFIGGAGKTRACITTDAQVSGLPGLQLIIAAGESDDPTQPGGELLLLGGAGVNVSGALTLGAGTTLNGQAASTTVRGGNSTNGFAGNLYLSGGLAGPLGGGSVHLIMTDTAGGANVGSIVFRVNSTVLWTINSSGAIFFGANGAGLPGYVLVSGGPNALPSWAATTGAGLLFPQTPAEQLASVVPVNYNYPEGDIRRYGALTFSADNVSALNQAVAVANAGSGVITIRGGTYITSPINALAANDVLIQCLDGGELQARVNSFGTSGDGTDLLKITGTRVRLYNLTLDGNQAAWSNGNWIGRLLDLLSNDAIMVGCYVKNSPAAGMRAGASGVEITNCHFDGNAGSGAELIACSYWTLSNCTFNFNGYGLQGSFNINGPVGVAFGFAARFRSHHLTLMGCQAKQNGLVGMNVNQGSYACKFIGCLAWSNNDSGFTISADSTSPSTPGNLENPYDLEYVDCESYDNWGAGLAADSAVPVNVTVDGGRYYNNGRAHGVLALNAIIFNGLYFAGNPVRGSLGIRIRTKAYDDRQLASITANAGGVLSATGWVAGTAVNYPRVALYNPALVFQGYATITAESAGSVTVAATANNGVAVSNIAAGWFISQRVQHNGCFLDNGSTGTVDVDGFGFLPGVFSYSGFKTVAGPFLNGTNVLLPAAQLDYNELLVNPTWDINVASWTFTLPAGAAANYFTTAGPLLRSPGCLQLVGGTSAIATAVSAVIASATAYVQGVFVEASCWAYAINAGDAQVALNWTTGGSPFSTPISHPGGGWKLIRIGAWMPLNVSALSITCTSAAGKTNYFDTASLRAKFDYTDSRDAAYPTRNLPV